MSIIQKINFPYLLPHTFHSLPDKEKVVIFFGTDFYNLPIGSNQDLFVIETNKILDFIRSNFPNRKLLYQAHPNETNEVELLDLRNFVIGERGIAEILLYDNASTIEFVFSVLSGASISAYDMGLNSAVSIDRLSGILPGEALTGYRSYFDGLPDYFFIKSYDGALTFRSNLPEAQDDTFKKIIEGIENRSKVWVLASDPALGLRGAIILDQLKKRNPAIETALIMIAHRRWHLLDLKKTPFCIIDDLITIPQKKVWYSLRPAKVISAIKSYLFLRSLSFADNDTLISFAHPQFEENCLLSRFKKIKKILFIENRWYKFVYEGGCENLGEHGMTTPLGTRFFNFVIEPVLGLYRSVYKQYDDGKVLNLFRYKKGLERFYDKIFVIMPGDISVIKKTHDEN